MNRVFMSVAIIALAILLAACTKSPYYAGQKNTDALKAAVTQDTFALFHIQGKAALEVLSGLKKASEEGAALQAVLAFAEEHRLQQIQWTAEDVEFDGTLREVFTATFERKIDEDDLGALLKKVFAQVESRGDGEFLLNGTRLLKLAGKGTVVYCGTRAMVRDAAAAFEKGIGAELPEAALKPLRKGEEFYLVVLRSDYLKRHLRRLPAELRQAMKVPPQSLSLSGTLEKGARLVARYEDREEAEAAGDGLRAALKLAKAKALPEPLAKALKELTVDDKGAEVMVAWEDEVVPCVASLFTGKTVGDMAGPPPKREKPTAPKPSVGKPAGESARVPAKAVSCLDNQRQLLVALTVYALDHEFLLPGADWEKAVEKYLRAGYGVHCPKSGAPYRFFGQGVGLDKVKQPGTAVLVSCGCDEVAGKRLVGFANGGVAAFEAAKVEAALRDARPGTLPTLK